MCNRHVRLLAAAVIMRGNLMLGVVPVRMNGRLMFPLCRTCAEETRQGPCDHTDDERRLYGTWTSVELTKAVQMGYELEVGHLS